MQYWVIKGNPAANDWDSMLVPGSTQIWHTGRVPSKWSRGDRLFCWESTPRLRVVGLATIVSTDLGTESDGDRRFSVRYLTRPLSSMPAIRELRRIPLLNTASFLKTGPATTLFPLSDEQAEILLGVVVARNPEIAELWRDVPLTLWSSHVPDVDELTVASEGTTKWIAHFVRERNRTIVGEKKSEVMAKRGALRCEVCNFDFQATYGELGAGYCEVHHRMPLSKAEGVVRTRLRDLAIVCSNCHRMLHRETPLLTIQRLRARLVRSRRIAAEA